MILRSVILNGYRSFKNVVKLNISERTTILIGPNDHGKTNALLAIEKLNADQKFLPEEANSNLGEGEPSSVAFVLAIDHVDAQEIRQVIRTEQQQQQAPEQASPIAVLASGVRQIHDALVMVDIPIASVRLTRSIGTELTPFLDHVPDTLQAAVNSKILAMLPKVVFFRADSLRQLPDTVDLGGLEQNEVMQGVFKLADIWDHRQRLLSGNTRKNEDELREASEILTRRIQENWTQGRDLKFYLGYDGNNVRLTVKDTAQTLTALADRSEGFTSYFAMRMLLVARTDTAKPNGYIFMFDEPGLNLHPKGQVDLQNVFEDLAQTNQIIYSTHSVFLINKNYPDRNHLIFKGKEGSNIDSKPFAGGWAKVKEHLGLYLSANFLFSDKVILAEGPTDEIYLPLMLQGLIARGKFNGDLNALAIHSGLNESEMLNSAGIYLREGRQPAILVDGDEEGDKRSRKINQWKTRTKRECPIVNLGDFKPRPCSIEDFLEPDVFRQAAVAACKQAVEEEIINPRNANWEAELPDKLKEKRDVTLGKRLEDVLKELFNEPISDVWVARKYSEIIQQADENTHGAHWADPSLLALAKAIWAALKLPTREDVAPFIG